MERGRIQLPSLYEPTPSSKVENLKDFRVWEECKKKAYHAELEKEIEQRRRSREKSVEEKTQEKVSIGTLVQQQRAKKANEKYAKIKTEQKYMQDNYKLMKKERNAQRLRQWWGECLQHPFVALLDEEQKRKKQTRRNFIFQNQLNDIQTQMKRSIRKRKKEESIAEGRNYIDFVESSFDKQLKDRMKFEQKYLKLDTTNDQSYKKEHLSFLQQQGEKRYSQFSNKSQEITRNKTNSVMKAFDPSPQRLDRLREQSARKLEHALSLRKQYNMNIIADPVPTKKTVTERAQPERARATSSMQTSSLIRHAESCSKPRKEYKHYDIINNCDRIITS